MKRESISKIFLQEKKKEENEFKKKQIMKEIEMKTEEKIISGFQSGEITNPISEKNELKQQNNQDILQSLLFDGAKEFKEKMGRDMTYGEMRSMYG